MPTLIYDGPVAVLDLGADENRFTPDSLAALHGYLDEVLGRPAPVALVTTGTGKFFSNGLDLDWMLAAGDGAHDYLASVQRLLARILGLPMPTVAAVNGHAFGAAAMAVLAHDAAVMRADRGFWCLPEVEIGLPFSPGMDLLVQARLPRRTAHEAMTSSRRYGGTDALAAGIVDAVAAQDDVLADAVARAGATAGLAGPTLGAVKRQLHGSVIAALDPSAG